MHVLRIEHKVSDYDDWKRVFDSDPMGRERSGVLRYQVLRSVDEPDYVMIDLEFEGAADAQRMHEALTQLWGRVDVIKDPRARVAELVQTEEY